MLWSAFKPNDIDAGIDARLSQHSAQSILLLGPVHDQLRVQLAGLVELLDDRDPVSAGTLSWSNASTRS